MTAVERKQAAQLPQAHPRVFSAYVPPATVLRLMSHTLAGEESINGRPAWIVHPKPKPDIPRGPGSSSLSPHLMDRSNRPPDKNTAKLSTPAPSFSEVVRRPPHSPASPRLPSSRIGEYYSGPPRPKSHWRQTHRFTDYQRFGSESTVLFEK